jgi:hypothetical protein
MEALLKESVTTGGDFCDRVVDIAVQVSNAVVVASFDTARQIGLQSVAFMDQDFLLVADTACMASYRGIQQLLDEELSSQDSSSTLELPTAAAAAAGGDPSGA